MLANRKEESAARGAASATMASTTARALWNTTAPRVAKRELDFAAGQQFLKENGRRLMDASATTPRRDYFGGLLMRSATGYTEEPKGL